MPAKERSKQLRSPTPQKNRPVRSLFFDPTKIAESAIAADGVDHSALGEIDERGIPKAPNFLVWCTGKDFLAIPSLFAKQAEIGLNLLGQFCPRCTDPELIDSSHGHKYLDLPVAMPVTEVEQRVVTLNFGVCPKCSVGRAELIRAGELKHHHELVGCAGMRSTKSTTVAMLVSYQVHRYCVVPDPARHLGLLPGQTLVVTLLAITKDQARKNLWNPFKHCIDHSPWFQNYHRFLDREGKRLGRKLYKYLDTMLHYTYKSIECEYYGADIEAQRGSTRIAASIDEIGYFDADPDSLKVRKNASQTYQMLSAAMQTVRAKAFEDMRNGVNDPLTAIDYYISSPLHVNDPIMRLLRDAHTDATKYAFHFATWQCVHGSTKIWTADGCADISALSAGPGLQETQIHLYGGRKCTHSYASVEKRPVHKLVTKHGYELVCAPDHRVKVLSDNLLHTFKRVSSLTRSDVVVMQLGGAFPEKEPGIEFTGTEFQYPSTMTTDLARVLGYCVSEAACGAKQEDRLTFYNGSRYVLNDYKKAISNVVRGNTFKILTYAPSQEKYLPRGRVSTPRTREVRDFFCAVGLGYELSYTKRIPDLIFRSTRASAGAFLSSLFEGDGGVDKADGTGNSVYYDTTSRWLADDVRTLLLRLGIQSASYSRVPSQPKQTALVKPRKSRRYYRVVIHGSEISKFSDFVGFRSPYKKKRLRDLLRKLGCTSAWAQRSDDLPVHATREFLKLYDDAKAFFDRGELQKIFGDARSVATLRFNKATGAAGRARLGYLLRNIAAQVDVLPPAMQCRLRALKNVVDDTSVFYEPVKSVRSTGRVQVYDLTVSDVHEYVSNGFISHNCNPTVTYESLRDKRAANPREFDRHFGAVPPIGANPFIENEEGVFRLQRPDPQHLASFQIKYSEDTFGFKSMYLLAKVLEDKSRPRIMAVDTGYSNNSFAISVMSWNKKTEKLDEELAIELAPENPETEAAVPVNFPKMYESCIEPLIKNLNVICVLYDRWNSLDQVQRIRDELRVKAIQVSLKYQDFLPLRTKINLGTITLPKPEFKLTDLRNTKLKIDQMIVTAPVAHLMLQMLTVREIGRQITKPLDGTDDLFRTLALCSWFADDVKRAQQLFNYIEGTGAVAPGRRGGALGVMASNRGASSKVGVARNRTGRAIGFRGGR